jgi:hypothetical protein
MAQIPNELADRLAGERPDRQPVLQTIRVYAHLGRIAQRIIHTELLDEPTVARATAVGRDDTLEGNFFAAGTGESNGH